MKVIRAMALTFGGIMIVYGMVNSLAAALGADVAQPETSSLWWMYASAWIVFFEIIRQHWR